MVVRVYRNRFRARLELTVEKFLLTYVPVSVLYHSSSEVKRWNFVDWPYIDRAEERGLRFVVFFRCIWTYTALINW
jgi:hypothetical protein